jgi:hypothetical protein
MRYTVMPLAVKKPAIGCAVAMVPEAMPGDSTVDISLGTNDSSSDSSRSSSLFESVKSIASSSNVYLIQWLIACLP